MSVDKQVLAKTLALFGEIVGKPVSPGLLGLYHEALADLTTEQFRARATALAKTRRFTSLPTPADFLDGPDQEAQAVVACERVLELVRDLGSYEDLMLGEHVDAQTMRAVEMAGGWLEVCDTVDAYDADKLGIWRSQFAKLWIAAGRDQSLPPPVSLGRHSTQNVMTGWLDPYTGVLTLPDRVTRDRKLIRGGTRTLPWAKAMLAYVEQKQLGDGEGSQALAVRR
jgi:hypothetical protein